MARFDRLAVGRVLSAAHIVRFAGFECTTSRLQNAGWQIAAREDFHRDEVSLLLNYPPADLHMLAAPARVDFVRYDHRDTPLVFNVIHCSSRMSVVAHEDASKFVQIDAAPQVAKSWEPKRIEDFGIFAAQLVRTEQIIVEPESVAECLAIIQKLQAPDLAEIRKRNRNREANEPMMRQAFHAQILSLAA